MKTSPLNLARNILIFVFAGIMLITLGSTSLIAKANEIKDELPPTAVSNPTPIPSTTFQRNPHIDNDCLGCHSNPGLTGTTLDGESFSLFIQPTEHQDSFHSRGNGGCKICHQDQIIYPHKNSTTESCTVCHWRVSVLPPPDGKYIFNLAYADERTIALNTNSSCQKCHMEITEFTIDSAHTRIMEEGNRYAPVCSDCHSGHDISLVTRQNVSDVCKKCHLAEYTTYKGSVHGAALEADGNPDVPTCVTCHGSHVVRGTDVADFRSETVKICGDCHSDPAIMDKFNISTDVLSTYMDDAHGMTDYYRKTNLAEITRATCYDCHGKHNILSPDDPNSTVYPENLQSTCQQCHQDANIRFPQSWLSHKKINSTANAGLNLVNRILASFVTIVVVVIVVLIVLDAFRRIKLKIKGWSKYE